MFQKQFITDKDYKMWKGFSSHCHFYHLYLRKINGVLSCVEIGVIRACTINYNYRFNYYTHEGKV